MTFDVATAMREPTPIACRACPADHDIDVVACECSGDRRGNIECERAGFRSVVAGITMPNDASVKLHEALGFAYVGTFRDAGWKHDSWCDVAWYQKRFATDAMGPRA